MGSDWGAAHDSIRERNTVMEQETFGKWLADALQERRLNQSEFARRIGVSYGTVNRWIREGRIPQPATYEPMARELGVSVDEVMTAAGVMDEGHARVGPRARLADLISWLPDQEIEAVLAFAEFRAERARASMRSTNRATSAGADMDDGTTALSFPVKS